MIYKNKNISKMKPTSKPLPKRVPLPAVKRPYPGRDADFDINSTNGPTIRRKPAEQPIVPPLVPITRTFDDPLMNETFKRIQKGIEGYKMQIVIPDNFEEILFAFSRMALHSQETIPQPPSNPVPIPPKTCQCHVDATAIKENPSNPVQPHDFPLKVNPTEPIQQKLFQSHEAAIKPNPKEPIQPKALHPSVKPNPKVLNPLKNFQMNDKPNPRRTLQVQAVPKNLFTTGQPSRNDPALNKNLPPNEKNPPKQLAKPLKNISLPSRPSQNTNLKSPSISSSDSPNFPKIFSLIRQCSTKTVNTPHTETGNKEQNPIPPPKDQNPIPPPINTKNVIIHNKAAFLKGKILY